jgi:hypothetical protein
MTTAEEVESVLWNVWILGACSGFLIGVVVGMVVSLLPR